MLLLLDNFDSFTYNLVDYFRQVGVEVTVRRNNEKLTASEMRKYNGIALSPGPETPQKAGVMPELIAQYVGKLPILGICLGHQAVGMHFGATLVKAPQPMHGKVSTIRIDPTDVMFDGLPGQLNVVRYHSLLLEHLPSCLKATAITAEGEVMALRHESLPVHGLQFHPEAALTQFGLAMLANWVRHYL